MGEHETIKERKTWKFFPKKKSMKKGRMSISVKRTSRLVKRKSFEGSPLHLAAALGLYERPSLSVRALGAVAGAESLARAERTRFLLATTKNQNPRHQTWQ
jgi:hypothetical protein